MHQNRQASLRAAATTGKRRSGKTRKGDLWLRAALIEAAQSAAGRTKATYLRSQYAELGGDYFIRREDQERLTRRLVRQLERLAQRVRLEPVAEPAR